MKVPMHTPGPWRWEIDRAHKHVALVGGRPTYDKTVMSFERWGVRSAVPVFNSACTDSLGWNTLYRVSSRLDWIEPIPGREHHAHWCASINHPDAKLIERAPEMDAALRDCLALAVRHRREEWAQHVMRFCAQGGVVPAPLRGDEGGDR